MYCISELQIDFILNDIRARGIETVSLQQDLLDHICCIIEQQLEENGDFERFYSTTITTFYKDELKEIEVETNHLLTHKNYYIMKKIMLYSGTFSAAVLSVGIFFKFMHWPGTAVCIILGLITLSIVFLPLMFTLKIKEKRQNVEKVILVTGAVSAILISVGVLFKIMHWPWANVITSASLLIMLFVFLPIYFFTGIRNPQTKINTIVSSILLLCGCGLILTLVRIPASTRYQHVEDTSYFFRNEQILKTEQALLGATTNSQTDQDIFTLCENIKSQILEKETGLKKLSSDFETTEALLGDTSVHDYISDSPALQKNLEALRQKITAFNRSHQSHANFESIPVKSIDFWSQAKVKEALNNLVQVQMMLLQNQKILMK